MAVGGTRHTTFGWIANGCGASAGGTYPVCTDTGHVRLGFTLVSIYALGACHHGNLRASRLAV